ncbi:heterokaryon incompatibility protein-domain-containing protein [Podospora didyma]|uniref:Heterokaryon incompatibility protein-domain-containing protein n=1 Tax=Podospora didyma TaxID=330526 RepID=A0AAE0NR27_9PEZI|nr:heterokaryon incompatibility protein-domain-containing protein [Podospora didyma]
MSGSGDVSQHPDGDRSSNGHTIRLIDTATKLACPPQKPYRYLALSYCWGPDPSAQLKTTKANLADHLSNIPVASLPAAIREAVIATRRLGVDCLWVDALCIVQDDAADRDSETALMGAIYAGAYCTLTASGAAHCDDGFLEKFMGEYKDCKFFDVPWYYGLVGGGDDARKEFRKVTGVKMSPLGGHIICREAFWSCGDPQPDEYLQQVRLTEWLELRNHISSRSPSAGQQNSYDAATDSPTLALHAIREAFSPQIGREGDYAVGLLRSNASVDLLWHTSYGAKPATRLSEFPKWPQCDLFGRILLADAAKGRSTNILKKLKLAGLAKEVAIYHRNWKDGRASAQDMPCSAIRILQLGTDENKADGYLLVGHITFDEYKMPASNDDFDNSPPSRYKAFECLLVAMEKRSEEEEEEEEEGEGQYKGCFGIVIAPAAIAAGHCQRVGFFKGHRNSVDYFQDAVKKEYTFPFTPPSSAYLPVTGNACYNAGSGLSGRTISDGGFYDSLEINHGHPSMLFMRRDLMKVLYSKLPGRERHIFPNKKIVDVKQDDSSVTVTCADGSAFKGDVLVGCDGVHSAVRGLTFEASEDPETRPPRAEYRGLFGSSPRPDGIPANNVTETHGKGIAFMLLLERDRGTEKPEAETLERYGDFKKFELAIKKERLQAIRQTTSAAAFAALFRREAIATQWDDDVLIRMFYNGLKTEVKDVMAFMDRPAFLDQYVEQVVKVDDRLY